MSTHTIAAEIKSLNTQLAKLEARRDVINKEITDNQSELAKINSKYKTLRARYEELTNPKSVKEPILSEHAIIRYLERVKGLDIAEISNEIMDEKTKNAIKFMKNGKINRDEYALVVRDSVVVSIIS
jgi:chromosome segregation ATPase